MFAFDSSDHVSDEMYSNMKKMASNLIPSFKITPNLQFSIVLMGKKIYRHSTLRESLTEETLRKEILNLPLLGGNIEIKAFIEYLDVFVDEKIKGLENVLILFTTSMTFDADLLLLEKFQYNKGMRIVVIGMNFNNVQVEEWSSAITSSGQVVAVTKELPMFFGTIESSISQVIGK